VYRLAQESLLNAARHAAARVELARQRANGRVLLEIRDDRRGITGDQSDSPGFGRSER
jgi:signal transduction histidine kinase